MDRKAKAKLISWLREKIADARADAKESSIDMNSYGHGYDGGYLMALRDVFEHVAGKPESR